ncbi:signal peptidase I [Maribellus maritimus]|uniref:signal peptidase I n=1 Tax=Maribellus maritimus TaxID=2870838 RepID=UPI00293F1726|nr:signal peptidase I [Maribellus maritimus]MCG6188126.1 signal peptidase I [Maribellus maritimus]
MLHFFFILLIWSIFCLWIWDKIYIVQSISMENLLFPGDVILVNKLEKIKMSIGRDDICLFTSNRKNIPSVKRIIGNPNDTIYLLNEHIYINGNLYLNPSTVKHKYWIKNRKLKRFCPAMLGVRIENNDTILTQKEVHTFESNNLNIASFEFELIKDSIFLYNTYFVVGDNRHFSKDSRHFGPIHKENIYGKAIFVLFNYHNGKFRWDRFLKKID